MRTLIASCSFHRLSLLQLHPTLISPHVLFCFPIGGVKIEYRDEDGRLLTQKEAFRQMSYKFHGHGPKQKKQEKRRKEISEMEAEAGNANKEFGTAANLQRTLTATGTIKQQRCTSCIAH